MTISSVKIKAVIFDLDGTLLDTIEDIAGSMNFVLRDLGYPEHSAKAYRQFVGEGLDTMVMRSLPELYQDETTVQRCLEAMRNNYARSFASMTRTYAGIPELLDELVKRKIILNVLSNKLDEFTKIMVPKYFPTHPFEVILGARPDCPLKPDPTAALEIAGELGLMPTEVVFVGDSGVDMRTAKNAGNVAAGALWGYRTEQELLDSGAQFLLRNPGDLLELI